MRCKIGHILKERPLFSRVLSEHFNRSVREHLTGVLSRIEFIAVLLNRMIAVKEINDKVDHVIISTGGIITAGRNIPVIPHSPEKDLGPLGKTARITRTAVVPLAKSNRLVSRVFQRFPERDLLRRDILSLSFKMERRASRVHHGP